MANLSNINGKFVVEQTTGYVGVGTTDPNYPIEVLNTSAEIALNASGGSTYRIQSDSASNFIIRKEGVGDRLVINSAGNSTFAGNINIGQASIMIEPSSGGRIGFNRNTGTGAILNSAYAAFQINGAYAGADYLDFQNYNSAGTFLGQFVFKEGKLGIGTDDPVQKLQVNGQVLFRTTTVDGGKNRFQLIPGGSSDAANLYLYYGNTGDGTLSVRINAQGDSYFNGGNVGIGTTTPYAQLHVSHSLGNGGIMLGNTATTGSKEMLLNIHPLGLIWQRWVNGAYQANLMTLDYDGKLGIGTTSPGAKLEIATLRQPGIRLSSTDTTAATNELLSGIEFYTPDFSAPRVSSYINCNFTSAFGDSYLSFGTSTGVGAATERMRIDSSGTIISTINDSTAATFKHIKLGGGTGVNGNGQYIQFSSSSNAALGSRIEGTREAAGGSSNLKIYTTNTGGSVTERMRITSAGAIEVRNGSIICGEVKNSGADNDFTLNGQRGQVIFEIAGSQAYVMDSQQIYPTADNARNLGTASSRFSVVYSANGVSTSDETLKENIKECDLGIDFIDSLKPKSYNLKDLKEDNDAYGKKRYGLIAQDILETELKDSVFGKKDGEYGLSYNDLIAPMIKAIQELKAEVDKLKQECKCKN